MINLVEMFADPDDMSFNQQCKHGNLVSGHAVYCHSDNPEALRKCRCSWYTGGRVKDEECPFYEPNLDFIEKQI